MIGSLNSFIKSRRTCHTFDDRPIENNIVLDAIDVANWAPNHYLTLPWHFYILEGDTKQEFYKIYSKFIKETSGEQTMQTKLERLKKVPVLIIVSCKKNNDKVIAKENYAACSCAIQNMSLSLWQHNIACKWSTHPIIYQQKLYDLLQINATNTDIIALLNCGYPQAIPNQKRPNLKTIYTITK